MGRRDLLEEYITERVNQIIGGIDTRKVREYSEKQDAILNSLDQESKKKFEELIDDLVAWEEEECRAIYVAAFLDGLRLGHRAF